MSDAASKPNAWGEVRSAVRYSLGLLDPPDRRKFRQVIAVQMVTSLLDLAGVLLLGAVGLMAGYAASGQPLPTSIETPLAVVGLEDWSLAELTVLAAAAAAFFLLAKGLLTGYLSRRALRILAEGQIGVSHRLSARILSMPFFSFQEKTSHDAAWVLGLGLQFSVGALLASYAVALTELSLLVILIIALLAVSPPITLFLGAYFLIILVILHRILGGWSHRVEGELARSYVSGQRSIQEALTLYPEIVVSGRRSIYQNKIDARLDATARASADQAYISQLPKLAYESALVVGMVIVAAWQFQVNDITAVVGVLAVFLAAGVRLLPALIRFQNAVVAIRARSANAIRVREFIDSLGDGQSTQVEPFDDARLAAGIATGHNGFVGSVELSNIELSYPQSDELALRGVSLNIPSGSAVAIVGATGAGKTSLMGVLLGVFNPDVGSAQIDGLAPASAIAAFPGAIAYVPQSIALVHGSVRENIALGLPVDGVDDALVWHALESAHLADFLRDSRQGLDTPIGEHGAQLSGGQRQRLGLARALYTRPRLLVLDEATSALDARTEALVAETLKTLRGSVTVVAVAHRAATMRAADRVVFMTHGQITASGTFDELRAGNESFRGMVDLLATSGNSSIGRPE